MTEPVICHDGKCRYKNKKTESIDACIDCDIAEQIEHDLLKKETRTLKNN